MKSILLVDDHELIYKGLALAMKGRFNLDYAPDIDTAQTKLKKNNYYAVILDVTLGERKGFEIIKDVPKRCYTYMLSMHKSAMYMKMAKKYGAAGYFLKDESSEYLLDALIKPVINRPFRMSPAVEREFL